MLSSSRHRGRAALMHCRCWAPRLLAGSSHPLLQLLPFLLLLLCAWRESRGPSLTHASDKQHHIPHPMPLRQMALAITHPPP